METLERKMGGQEHLLSICPEPDTRWRDLIFSDISIPWWISIIVILEMALEPMIDDYEVESGNSSPNTSLRLFPLPHIASPSHRKYFLLLLDLHCNPTAHDSSALVPKMKYEPFFISETEITSQRGVQFLEKQARSAFNLKCLVRQHRNIWEMFILVA